MFPHFILKFSHSRTEPWKEKKRMSFLSLIFLSLNGWIVYLSSQIPTSAEIFDAKIKWWIANRYCAIKVGGTKTKN
jgi:hypothetical protein